MFNKTYRNQAGKSFTEGRRFCFYDFLDYYDTLTDDEWEDAIRMAAKKGVDISYIRIYRKSCCNSFCKPMSFEDICEPLLQIHGFNEPMTSTCTGVTTVNEERNNIVDFYARLGVPVPKYWKEKLWH